MALANLGFSLLNSLFFFLFNSMYDPFLIIEELARYRPSGPMAVQILLQGLEAMPGACLIDLSTHQDEPIRL